MEDASTFAMAEHVETLHCALFFVRDAPPNESHALLDDYEHHTWRLQGEQAMIDAAFSYIRQSLLNWAEGPLG